jgi:hypothetical protein
MTGSRKSRISVPRSLDRIFSSLTVDAKMADTIVSSGVRV